MYNRWELLSGALLHDIGKFMQRAHPPGQTVLPDAERMRQLICPFDERTGRFTHEHALWTQAFFDHVKLTWPPGIDGAAVAAIARSHHKASSVEEIIVQEADRLSAGQDRISDEADMAGSRSFREAPLLPAFESIGQRNTSGPRLAYRIVPLDQELEAAFPVSFEEAQRKAAQGYAALWRQFTEEARSIRAETPEAFIAALMALLHKFTWCFPSSTVDLPDVSLFDHLKTTAAFAACLYQVSSLTGAVEERVVRDRQARKFILLEGDLSGIQDYLFGTSEIGVGKTAKRLRARSFFIGMLAEVAAMKLLRAFELTPLNALMCSGGRFVLLLPNLPDAPGRISRISEECEKWLYDNLHGQLRLNLAYVAACGDEFVAGRFAELLARTGREMQAAKRRPLSRVLQNENAWREGPFLLDAAPEGQTWQPCRHCGSLPAWREDAEGIAVCRVCEQDVETGRLLPKASLTVFFDGESTGSFRALGQSFDLVESGQAPRHATWGIALNDFGVSARSRSVPVWHRWIANTIPRAGDDACASCPAQSRCDETERPSRGAPLTFACLARRSRGRKALACLKGDVDHLGKTFAVGLRKNMRTVSRLAALSRMLDLFFAGWTNRFIARQFPDAYIVYSGGDDFLLLGPWDLMIELAELMRAEWERFCCNRLTFSCGLTLARPGTPVAVIASLANSCLETAKEQPACDAEEARNQIHLFSTTLKWYSFTTALAEAQRLAAWMDAGVVNPSAARRLLIYADMWRRYRATGDTSQLRFIPLLTYDLSRNWPAESDASSEQLAARQWADRFRNVEEKSLDYLRFVVEYALNTQR